MDPRQNREWMYAGRKCPWEFSDEWRDKAEEFVNKAFDISSRPMTPTPIPVRVQMLSLGPRNGLSKS